MILFPAIDLFEGKAVRLFKGDYAQMTVYSEHPEEIGKDFAACGATHAHLVDLEGAKSGETPNLETVIRIRESSGLFCEIGGGIRSMEVVKRYLDAGLDRVILPGVGAFEDAARKLRESGLDEVVREEAAKGKPLLGICLGMQMLFERSYEYGVHEGLGLLKGEIRPIAERIP